MKHKPIVIGCDNAAVALKNTIKTVLDEQGIPYEDVGVNADQDSTAYPSVAALVAQKIIDSKYEKEGILICGTGIGMSITANKFPGIYAAVCHDAYSAERARLSNNTNVMCMGARVIGPELARKLAEEWLGLEFKGGRSAEKLQVIREIEQRHMK
jgi:ribose 5-phosphate isomerase B